MVPVVGFPRPVYPPDVPRDSGHQPSSDGPDVIAYKRAVSRLGRWPWQPFDGSYSNAFSHGKTDDHGQVRSTGVEGCQRQQPELDETGWIGKKTFNFFRAARIPAPLPHAGEPALDALALNLIAEAYAMFHPPPKPTTTVRQAALELARTFIGTTESPAGSNCTPFGRAYGMDGQPWCAMFTTYCYEHGSQGGSPSFVEGSRYAYVPYIVGDAQAHRYGLAVTSSPVAGDLVCYDWDGGDYDHVGLFESGTGSSWQAVEGNTSPDNNGSQSNGGGVYRRSRSTSDAHRVAFVRVAEP
jgi:hypothetical protein